MLATGFGPILFDRFPDGFWCLTVFGDSLTASSAASVEVIGLMIRCLLSELRPLRFSSDAIASLTQSFPPFARSCLSRSATQDSRAG
ncbi:hypothetical protein DDI_3663 [Dickeya dianthicola RNS04.9]|nr:hypothetical protein DDI_3663 [Dickeya dianthicola RNS04.9]